MKNRRFWPDYCGFLSLAISVAMIILWICGVWDLKVVNLNTFVGVTVALLGLIVTLAIAWQIYNALDMKNKVEELKQLEGKLEEQKKSFEKFKLETTRDIYGAVWVNIQNDNPLAFFFVLSALEAEIQLEEPSQQDDILDSLELVNKNIEDNMEIETKELEEIIKQDKDLRSHSNYRFIKRRYEPIFDEFISKVKKVGE